MGCKKYRQLFLDDGIFIFIFVNMYDAEIIEEAYGKVKLKVFI